MRWEYVIFALGISVCLIGALVMVAGEPILGEDHTGIATVIGTVGIGIVATSGVGFSAHRTVQRPNKSFRTIARVARAGGFNH